jgi:plasmid stabilization system protein ParE
MDREVVWSHSATTDLESIIEHIYRDSEFYAAMVARELVSAARSLTTFSERGRVVPEYEDSTIREIIVRVRSDRVEVLRIIHGARQMPPTV